MEEASCKVKILRDYKGNLNSIFVKKDTLKERSFLTQSTERETNTMEEGRGTTKW
jgi:hypothetical protein